MKKEESKSIPIRMDAELLKKIDKAASLTGLPKQEIIRLCTAIGLEDLRRINYDIAGAIVNQTKGPAPLLKVAETPHNEPMQPQVHGKYTTKKNSNGHA